MKSDKVAPCSFPSSPENKHLFFMHRLFLQALLSEMQLLLNKEREWALYFVEEGMFMWLTISEEFVSFGAW